MRTVPFPMLHVPPCLEGLNGLKVIQTGYVIHSQMTLTKVPINVCINQERLSLEGQSFRAQRRRRRMYEWFDIRVEANEIKGGGGSVVGDDEDGGTDEQDQEGEGERVLSLF